ncbi:UNVERIFIED_CONTAM: hypothetical protein Slati_1385300 [Sesamum latifolium]|uniref:Uncharacterized protein n=1 Tax=Sesamum latifolium TaxID=2727402 RepID=A0AAW2X4U0_9LAMI
MTPNRTGDNSSDEVSEEVLRRRGSATGPTDLRRGVTGAGGAGADHTLLVGAKDVPATTCKT